MNKNQEKISAALDRIEEGLATINTDMDWLQFLYFQSRFYNYSFGNTMLIYLQNPQARYVKGFRAWNELARYVKRGSKGISILAPCFKKAKDNADAEDKADHEAVDDTKRAKVISGFRIAYVYDISDTDGADEFLPVLVRGLSGNGVTEKELYDRLLEIISAEYKVTEVTGTASKGSYSLETGIISVNTDYDYMQRIKTLLHEYAHALDFKMHPEMDISRNRRELIAESVAFVVASCLEIDTGAYSISYIKTWLKDTDELKVVAETVQKISNEMINKLSESLDEFGNRFSRIKENAND